MTSKSDLINSMMCQGPFEMVDVVKWSNRLLPRFVPAQNRYKVSDRVSIRTVRYYLSQSLISKPDSYQGRNAVFSAGHVIQILAIKYLQAQYIPLKKIAQIMNTVDQQRLSSWLIQNDLDVQVVEPTMTIESIVNPVGKDIVTADDNSTLTDGRTWQRFPIHNDVELYVAPGFNLYDHYSESGDILTRIMQALTGGEQRSRDRKNKPTSRRPARAIADPDQAVIALVTEGGLVPKGNPDHLPSARSESYRSYSLEGLDDFVSGAFESVDRGWDNTFVNEDPDRLVPLDVMREFEGQRMFSHLHEYFFSTTGVGTSVENARRIGRGITREIKDKGVSAVLLTAT